MFSSSNTIITTDNNEFDVGIRSYDGDKSDMNIDKSKNEENKFTCLPNIFDDRKTKKSLISSKEFDDFIFPGFRKELFKATWKGGEK